MEIITLREVLAEMEKRERPFSVTFITCDKKKNTGGEILRIENALMNGKSEDQKKNTKEPVLPSNDVYSLITKRPNHYKNRTRNIRILGTSQIRKLHIRLITEFNSKKVYY